jgi:hypothetical protein
MAKKHAEIAKQVHSGCGVQLRRGEPEGRTARADVFAHFSIRWGCRQKSTVHVVRQHAVAQKLPDSSRLPRTHGDGRGANDNPIFSHVSAP